MDEIIQTSSPHPQSSYTRRSADHHLQVELQTASGVEVEASTSQLFSWHSVVRSEMGQFCWKCELRNSCFLKSTTHTCTFNNTSLLDVVEQKRYACSQIRRVN